MYQSLNAFNVLDFVTSFIAPVSLKNIIVIINPSLFQYWLHIYYINNLHELYIYIFLLYMSIRISFDQENVTQIIIWRGHLTKIVSLVYVDSMKVIISGSTDESIRYMRLSFVEYLILIQRKHISLLHFYHCNVMISTYKVFLSF